MSDNTYNNATTEYLGEMYYSNPHIRIHKGQMFSAQLLSASVANNAYLDILFIPTQDCHIEISLGSEGKSLFSFYENPINVTLGTPMTPYNHRRNSPLVTSSTLKSAPTVTDVGTTLLQAGYIFGGTGGNTVGGLRTSRNEFMLNPSKTYLIRLQNVSGTAKSMDIQLSWYEED